MSKAWIWIWLALLLAPAWAEPLQLFARASGTSALGVEAERGDRPILVQPGSRVELQARTFDPSVNTGRTKLAYHWRQISGPAVSLLTPSSSGATAASYMNLLLQPSAPGLHRFECLVQWLDAAGRPTGVAEKRHIELQVG